MAKGLKTAEEWYKQVDYDLRSAKILYTKKQNVHCIFFCHLAIEKALKGFYTKKTKKAPVKTHNIMYFIEQLGLRPEEEVLEFLTELNRWNIPTRYPEMMFDVLKQLNRKKTTYMLKQSKEVIKWIKKN